MLKNKVRALFTDNFVGIVQFSVFLLLLIPNRVW